MDNPTQDQPESPADPLSIIKVSVNLYQKDVDMLKGRAWAQNTSVTLQLRSAITAWAWMLDQWRENKKILLEDPDGVVHLVVPTPPEPRG